MKQAISLKPELSEKIFFPSFCIQFKYRITNINIKKQEGLSDHNAIIKLPMTDTIQPEEYQHKLQFAQAMAQLDAKEKEIKESQGYAKAYLLSILIPPLGIYYLIKYRNKAGIISLILTLLSLWFSIWLMNSFLKQTSSLIPLETLDNQQELLQLLK